MHNRPLIIDAFGAPGPDERDSMTAKKETVVPVLQRRRNQAQSPWVSSHLPGITTIRSDPEEAPGVAPFV
jgi:hypothetical protein